MGGASSSSDGGVGGLFRVGLGGGNGEPFEVGVGLYGAGTTGARSSDRGGVGVLATESLGVICGMVS